MSAQRHAVIVGAGLAGTLLAIALARDSWRVSLFERRTDPRAARAQAGRSINLAVSARGIHALRFLDLDHKILAAQAIPMRGRLLHAPDLSLAFQPYSAHGGDAIHSFSRAGLNLALLHEAAAHPAVSLHFEHTCTDADLQTCAALFRRHDNSTIRAQADMLVATDGAYSAVRAAFLRADRFEYAQSYLTHAYKELHIPPDASPDEGTGGGGGGGRGWLRDGAQRPPHLAALVGHDDRPPQPRPLLYRHALLALHRR